MPRLGPLISRGVELEMNLIEPVGDAQGQRTKLLNLRPLEESFRQPELEKVRRPSVEPSRIEVEDARDVLSGFSEVFGQRVRGHESVPIMDCDRVEVLGRSCDVFRQQERPASDDGHVRGLVPTVEELAKGLQGLDQPVSVHMRLLTNPIAYVKDALCILKSGVFYAADCSGHPNVFGEGWLGRRSFGQPRAKLEPCDRPCMETTRPRVVI